MKVVRQAHPLIVVGNCRPNIFCPFVYLIKDALIPANSLMPSLHSSKDLNLHEVTFKDSYSPVRQSSLIDISLAKNASVDCIQYKIQDFPSLVENY